MKSSGIGGQAVLEGVMMKNKEKYAIAVRKPNNEIAIKINEYKGISDKHSLFKLPIFRGIAAFADSLFIGTKAITFSSTFFEEEEQKPKEKKSSDGFFTFLTFFLSIVVAVGVFILLPLFLANLVSDKIDSFIILGLIEGALRVALFVGYVVAISQMKDIKRFFQYHGAEHKTINCIEKGYELTVSNVKRQSKEHKRCGTSFMLFVMLVSIVLFMFIQVDTVYLRYILRILLVPVIAGISYEIIRLAGRTDNIFIRIISKPGMWMQGLTTKEPDDSMIEVAIASVEAVFDWKAYLAENFKKYSKKYKKSDASKNAQTDNINHPVSLSKAQDTEVKKEEVAKQVVTKAEKTKEKSSKDKAISTHTQEIRSNKMQEQAHKNLEDSKQETAVTVEEEFASLDKKLFDEPVIAEQKHANLVERAKSKPVEPIISSTEIVTSLEPDASEEEDAILRALDRYLSFDKDDQ